MLLYDAAYVVFASLSARSLAPLRGRVHGLREWRLYRERGAPYRQPVVLGRPLGFRRALQRHRAWHGESAT